jgi:hypothetical protein
MVWLAIAVLLAVTLPPLVISIRRSTELFVLRVQAGQVRFVRGRMPQGLLGEIVDIVSSPPIARATLTAVRRRGRAEWLVRGSVEGGQLQRLRNVLGRYSLQRILAGGKPSRPR